MRFVEAGVVCNLSGRLEKMRAVTSVRGVQGLGRSLGGPRLGCGGAECRVQANRRHGHCLSLRELMPEQPNVAFVMQEAIIRPRGALDFPQETGFRASR